MAKKVKFKDLTDKRVQIIENDDGIFDVLSIERTFLHNHFYVKLMNLNHKLKSECYIRSIMAQDFNDCGFEWIYNKKKNKGD